MKQNIIFIGVIAVLIGGIVIISVCFANAPNKAEMNQLKKDNTTLNDQVKKLTADGQGAHQEAVRFEKLFAEDTTHLVALQYKFDSLTTVLNSLKSYSHAETKAIAALNSAGTDSLFAINKARFRHLVTGQ